MDFSKLWGRVPSLEKVGGGGVSRVPTTTLQIARVHSRASHQILLVDVHV